jgi:capsular exopolysaccharide synthesis family protein
VPDFTQLNRANHGPSRYLPSRPADKTQRSDGIPGSNLVDSFGAFSSVSEAYRAIRIGILLSQAEAPPKAILITSGYPTEGKTVTAINTASAFAQMGENVLLIDADLRRPRCHQVLQVTQGAGLTEILTGNRTLEDVVCSTGIDRLSLITAGSLPPNPGELLGSKKMTALISDLKQRYDCVLIDSAPIIPVTDSLLLASKVDGVVLVAGPRTSREDLRTVCSRLFQLRAKILGVVLNRFPVTGQYYKRYYNYYSAPNSSVQRANRNSLDELSSATRR